MILDSLSIVGIISLFGNVILAKYVCDENSCVNGVCVGDGTDSKCFCYDGYTGLDCSVNFDECLPGRNQCQNNATCINEAPDVKCVCVPGFCGKFCETEIDECQSNPCLNGAVCVDKLDSFECVCLSGYTGNRCENDVDACDATQTLNRNRTNYCENGGTCKDGPGENYFCVCPPGFSGEYCEAIIDECDSQPCLNQGKCEKTGNTFKCICPYGWSGKLCEKKMYQCSIFSNRCQNGALCMNTVSDKNGDIEESYCFCQPDYHGEFCEKKFDDCQPNVCQNDALCVDQIDNYTCLCRPGFAGLFCEIDCSKNSKCSEILVTETNFIESSVSIMSTVESSFDILSTKILDSLSISQTRIVSSISSTPQLYSTLSPSVTISNEFTTPTVELPKVFDNSSIVSNKLIYAPNFNGVDSKISFRFHRVKRMSSSLKMTIITENDDGTVLYASTNKYNLLIFLHNLKIIAELNNNLNSQNLLRLESSLPIELFKPFNIKLTMIASGSKKSLYVELAIIKENKLIHSISNQKNNITLPCFEIVELGQPSYLIKKLDSEKLESKPFKGCILNFSLNEEEKFVKDSIEISNISECFSKICEQNPCRNRGICNEKINNQSWHCSCSIGFKGWLCENVYCDSNYCLNGGMCLLENTNKHLCICPQNFHGPRCEFQIDLKFPSFNIGTHLNASSTSFIKYRLPYNIKEFFEIRFRFIVHDIFQKSALMIFMSQNPYYSNSDRSVTDFFSLVYDQQSLLLKFDLGQGGNTVRAPIEPNVTEQMVVFGRFKKIFWLLIIPSEVNESLKPRISQTAFNQSTFNVDPYLYVGGHENWRSHIALFGLKGFQGCIYDIDIRISKNDNFTRIEENLIDSLTNVDQCDFECS